MNHHIPTWTHGLPILPYCTSSSPWPCAQPRKPLLNGGQKTLTYPNQWLVIYISNANNDGQWLTTMHFWLMQPFSLSTDSRAPTTTNNETRSISSTDGNDFRTGELCGTDSQVFGTVVRDVNILSKLCSASCFWNPRNVEQNLRMIWCWAKENTLASPLWHLHNQRFWRLSARTEWKKVRQSAPTYAIYFFHYTCFCYIKVFLFWPCTSKIYWYTYW